MKHRCIDTQNHLQMLRGQAGNIFYFSRKEQVLPFIAKTKQKILTEKHEHSVIIIEQPRSKQKTKQAKAMVLQLGQQLEDASTRRHRIHYFFVPTPVYEQIHQNIKKIRSALGLQAPEASQGK